MWMIILCTFAGALSLGWGTDKCLPYPYRTPLTGRSMILPKINLGNHWLFFFGLLRKCGVDATYRSMGDPKVDALLKLSPQNGWWILVAAQMESLLMLAFHSIYYRNHKSMFNEGRITCNSLEGSRGTGWDIRWWSNDPPYILFLWRNVSSQQAWFWKFLVSSHSCSDEDDSVTLSGWLYKIYI